MLHWQLCIPPGQVPLSSHSLPRWMHAVLQHCILDTFLCNFYFSWVSQCKIKFKSVCKPAIRPQRQQHAGASGELHRPSGITYSLCPHRLPSHQVSHKRRGLHQHSHSSIGFHNIRWWLLSWQKNRRSFNEQHRKHKVRRFASYGGFPDTGVHPLTFKANGHGFRDYCQYPC